MLTLLAQVTQLHHINSDSDAVPISLTPVINAGIHIFRCLLFRGGYNSMHITSFPTVKCEGQNGQAGCTVDLTVNSSDSGRNVMLPFSDKLVCRKRGRTSSSL